MTMQSANRDQTSDDLRDFLQQRNLNQISTRLFYLYLRTVQASEQDRTTLFNYLLTLLGTITTVGGFILAVLNLASTDVVIGSVLGVIIIIVALVIIRKIFDPNRKTKLDLDKIWLSLHLDQIEKQSLEILGLKSILKRDAENTYALELRETSCDILKSSLDRVTEIKKAIGSTNLPGALKSVHISEDLMNDRMNFGKRILDEYCTGLANKVE
jgi:hypothetical protein